MRKKDAQCLLQAKIENIYLFKKNLEHIFKNWLCPNFSCCPKNLSRPKFSGGWWDESLISRDKSLVSQDESLVSRDAIFISREGGNLLLSGTVYCIGICKITKIVRTLWLAERLACMRVCNHGCDVTLSVSPAHFKSVSLTLKYKY